MKLISLPLCMAVPIVLTCLISGMPLTAYGTTPTKEETLIFLVNSERSSQGLSSLDTDSSLIQAASIRAQEIARSFSHTRPDGSSCFSVLQSGGILYEAAGENLAYGQTSPEEALADWMASPGHQENLLDPAFQKTGIAVYYDEDTYYWVQLFISN